MIHKWCGKQGNERQHCHGGYLSGLTLQTQVALWDDRVREKERERDPHTKCVAVVWTSKAELGHISGRLSENRARAEFPDCSDTLASDNKSFVRWSHSVKSAIRSTQRDFISPSPPCPTSTLALALPVTPCSHSEQCQCVCVHRDLN